MATPKGPFYEALGQLIRAARRTAHITQAQLASAVELSRTSVTNIEKGRQPVMVDILVRIAETLGVSVSSLIPKSYSRDEEVESQVFDSLPPDEQEWYRKVLSIDQEELKGET